MITEEAAEPTAAGTAHDEHAPRIDYARVAPAAVRAQFGLEQYVRGSGLEHSLQELVKLRASYMNGCAYCVDMHTKDARVAGETEQRLYAVPVWRETPFFTPRERAALAWTEVVTDIGRTGVPDEVYARAREHFSEEELVNLTMAVITINGWNRLAVTFRAPVGTYQPSAKH
ncbi:carboxymuconolactone decarboxylase family protein [Longimicrobium sp.]|uniref:carboxymuconolactone decarboxylase family protein n=1 Tax=Longimicrobium sp. TaxID=2029185 RepID=UPI0032C23440